MSSPSRPPMPVGRPVTSASRATPTVIGTPVPAMQGRIVNPSYRSPRERILLCGDSFSGKSYAYMRLAHKLWEQARSVGEDPPNFHVIDTNDTMPKFLYAGGEFEHLAGNVGGNVFPYPCFEWQDVVNSWTSIRRAAKPGDWVVADLISQVYNFAQQQVANARGKVLTDEAYNRALANKGFGAFEAGDWQLVKLINETVITGMLNDARLNAILVTHVTEIVDVEGRNKREALLLFDQIGLKPQAPDVAYRQPDTVIMLWANRYIDRDQKGRRQGKASTVRNMAVLKDRGVPVYERVIYDRDCFDKLDEVRAQIASGHITYSNAVTDEEIDDVMTNQGVLTNTEDEAESEEPAK